MSKSSVIKLCRILEGIPREIASGSDDISQLNKSIKNSSMLLDQYNKRVEKLSETVCDLETKIECLEKSMDECVKGTHVPKKTK